MNTRTDLLNTLIQKFKYQNYLEIGLANMINFRGVQIAKKVGIDPSIIDHLIDAELYDITSDDFFEKVDPDRKFDIVFIDGDHHAEQFLKDVDNCLKHLMTGGIIVCHDCNPITYERQVEKFVGGAWNGTVWKGWAQLRMSRSDLEMFVFDMDEGCGIIRPGSQLLYQPEKDVDQQDILQYSYLEKHRIELLNLIPTTQFSEKFPGGFQEHNNTPRGTSLGIEGDFPLIPTNHKGYYYYPEKDIMVSSYLCNGCANPEIIVNNTQYYYRQSGLDTNYQLINSPPTITWKGRHYNCYGHAILDNLYPMYLYLKSTNQLNDPIHVQLCDSDGFLINQYNQPILDIVKAICNAVSVRSVSTPTSIENKTGLFANDNICSQIKQLMNRRLKQFGNELNTSFFVPKQYYSSTMREFVNKIVTSYHLESVKQEPNLVTIAIRPGRYREILNISEITQVWTKYNYRVEIADFAQMSPIEQIKQIRRSRFLMGSYGSNLVNAIFLPQSSGIIVCWPNPDVKQFWPRKYCVIHSAILSLGHTIYELDKEYYDQNDRYHYLNNPSAPGPSYSFQDNNVLKLKPEKNTYIDVMDCPTCNYDLLAVDFSVDIKQLDDFVNRLSNQVIAPIPLDID